MPAVGCEQVINWAFNMDLCNYEEEPYFPVDSPHLMCPQACGCSSGQSHCPGSCPAAATRPTLAMLDLTNSRTNATTVEQLAVEIAEAFVLAMRDERL